jgi:hypothetical protein
MTDQTNRSRSILYGAIIVGVGLLSTEAFGISVQALKAPMLTLKKGS